MVRPIHPESALAELPVVKIVVIRVELGPPPKSHAIDAVAEVLAKSPSVTESAHTLLHTAGSRGNEPSAAVFGILGDDVDHAVHGICSPNSATRPANHFYAFHVLHHYFLQPPIDSGKKRRIHVPPIDHNEDRFGETVSESADADGPRAGVDLCNFNTGHQPQDLRDAGSAGTPDILLRQDVDCRRSALHFLRFLGDRCHFKVAELFKT